MPGTSPELEIVTGAVVTDARIPFGQAGEERAAAYLASLGYQFIARNMRTAYGEVDLIMKDGGEHVFVEVKTRHTQHQGHPSSAVTPRKLQHIQHAAESYLTEHAITGPWRIDVVAIVPDTLEHFKNVTLA